MSMLEDTIMIPAILLIFAVMTVVAYFTFTQLQNEDFFTSTGINVQIKENLDRGLKILNYSFVMIVVSLIIGLMILGYYLDTPAIFAVPAIIIAILAIFISAPISNAFTEFEADFPTEMTKFNLISTFMGRLPLIVLIASIVYIIALYAKRKYTQGEFG